MKVSDMLLPHRQLINRSLRKSSDELRSHIDAYKARYEEQLQRCKSELEQVKLSYNKEYEKAELDFVSCLSKCANDYQKIGNLISEYASLYFNRKLIYKKKEINKLQTQIVAEYINFLSSQMKTIGEEIEHLKKRIILLSQKAQIDDVVQLISLSGNNLPVENSMNAMDLLDFVTEKIKDVDTDTIQRYALLNIKTLLEERVSYVDEIKYLTWVINQKIQLSKELRTIREKQKGIHRDIKAEENDILMDLDKLNANLLSLAVEIRFYWAKAVVNESINITDYKIQKELLRADLDDKRDAKQEIQRKINDMINSHSNDNWEWERLQRDKKEYSDDIQSLSSDLRIAKINISQAQSKRADIIQRRNALFTLMKNHSIVILCIGERSQSDEKLYVEHRLKELDDIVEAGRIDADQKHQLKLAQLQSEKQVIMSQMSDSITLLQESVRQAKEEYDRLSEEYNLAIAKAKKLSKAYIKELDSQIESVSLNLELMNISLQNAKASDNRFLFVQLFSESSEVIQIREKILILLKKKEDLISNRNREIDYLESGTYSDLSFVNTAFIKKTESEKRLIQLRDKLEEAHKEYDRIDQDYDKKIQDSKPYVERPNISERNELRRLKMWLSEYDDHHFRKKGRRQ